MFDKECEEQSSLGILDRIKAQCDTLTFLCCVTYIHVPDELRKKLDNKGHKYIFVGYSEEAKGYKLYDPVARKFIIICDVQFMENEPWKGSVEKIVKIINTIVHYDAKEEMVQTPCISKCDVPSTPGTVTQITIHSTPVRTSCV